MTPLRWLIVAFWVFVVLMLAKECHDSDVARQKEAATLHPTGSFFYTTPQVSQPTPQPQNSAADVQQTGFVVQEGVPAPGNFTCQITLKNVGGTGARNISIRIRPFRGGRTGSDNFGHVPYGILGDNDPLSQMGTYVSFPDLAPGQESTQSAVFLDQPNVTPGNNPKPEISFESAKGAP